MEPTVGTLYIAVCQPTGKYYVGITIQRFGRRKSAHRRAAEAGNDQKFYRAIRKYGFDAFEWFSWQIDVNDLCDAECELIEILDSYRNGYNATTGGDEGWKHDPETTAKISAANLGRVHTEESKRKRSAALAGRPHSPEHTAAVAAANRGKKRSAEACARMSAAQVGKRRSEEHRRRISEGQMGRTLTAEWRANMARARTGKKHTAETRAKISALQVGRKQSAETIAKRKASLARYYANRRQEGHGGGEEDHTATTG